jgi:chaperonin GroEL
MQELKLVKELAFGDYAKGQLLTGVQKLTNAVSSTLGASGKCVILEDQHGEPVITKDGVTVANSITLRRPIENIGATLIKQAAQRTVQEAGDGTTTATVLAQAILDEIDKHSLLEDTRMMKEGIHNAVDKVIEYLNKKAKKVNGKKIDQVATISANNDKHLGDLIAKAFKSVDKTGVVMLETSDDETTYVEYIEGIEYPASLKSHHFINNKTQGTSELINPLVLICESPINSIRKIQKVLEYVISNKKALLIIAEVDHQVSTALAMNKVKGNLNVNVIDAPAYGISKKGILEDLALVTNGRVINEDLGDDMDLISVDDLGYCLKATTSKENTILQCDLSSNEDVSKAVKRVKTKINKTKDPNLIIKLENKLAKYTGKVAVVKVGANSEVELKEKRDRAEDAICATKAAIKQGILPGGGIALLNASQVLEPKSMGEEVLYEAIKRPFEVIMKNAGIEYDNIPNEEGIGYNVVTGKTVDMVQAGIIDPLLVTKSALKNAASVATTIMSTDCIINNVRDESSR